MPDLRRRIDLLEDATTGNKPLYVVAIRAANETAEAAVARHRVEHPETPENAELIVFVSGFSIAERDPIP